MPFFPLLAHAATLFVIITSEESRSLSRHLPSTDVSAGICNASVLWAATSPRLQNQSKLQNNFQLQPKLSCFLLHELFSPPWTIACDILSIHSFQLKDHMRSSSVTSIPWINILPLLLLTHTLLHFLPPYYLKRTRHTFAVFCPKFTDSHHSLASYI